MTQISRRYYKYSNSKFQLRNNFPKNEISLDRKQFEFILSIIFTDYLNRIYYTNKQDLEFI